MSDCYSVIPADQEVVGGVPEGAPFNFPPEGAYALFWFTNETFTKVLSALWNGAALTYPEEMYQVIWYFLQNVEEPVSLCDQIAACIETSEGTRDAIRDMLATDTITRTIIQQIGSIPTVGELERGQNLLKPDQCNPDYLFNQTSALVFLLDQLVEDIFQAVEVGTNAIERAEKLVAAIPVIGALPFDEIIGAADRLIAEVQEAYAGAYDASLYDELRCALFCAIRDDCTLTIENAVSFYEVRLGEAIPKDPAGTLLAVVQYIAAGSIVADAPVYAMHLFALACIRTAQNVFGIDFAILALRIKAAGDEPDNDWMTLCDECVTTWSKTWNFADGEVLNWEIAVGDFIPGTGFQSTGAGPYAYTVDIGRDVTWPAGSSLTQIIVGATSTVADGAAFRGVYYPGTAFAAQTGYTANTGDYSMSFSANNPNPPRIEIQNSNTLAVPGVNTIRLVTLQGTGDEPDWDA